MTNRTQVLEQLKAGKTAMNADYLLVVPTYNEGENIEELISRIKRHVTNPLQILVIDDGSPDGTADIVAKLAQSIPGLLVFKRSGKLGLGSAYLEGFSLAQDSGFEFVMTMDSDLSHDPIVINAMIAKSHGHDLVIGSRYCPGGDIPNFELWRRCMSKGGNWLARTLLGIKAGDCTSGFRCYRASILKDLDPEHSVASRQYIFLVEILMLLTMRKYRIAEVPIIFNQRTSGETKVSPG